MTSREKIAVHRRRLVPLLNQLELHIAGIGQCNREVNVIVALLLVPEGIERQFLGDIPGTDAADLDPMANCLVDVAHDKAHLTQRPEQAALGLLPPIPMARLSYAPP